MIYLAPPQAWAWRSGRAQQLSGLEFVGCLFPFTTDWYRARGVNAHWVGHPLASHEPPTLKTSGTIALMPGSRLSTVERVLPSMVQLADSLSRTEPELRFELIVAPTLQFSEIHHLCVPSVAKMSKPRTF